MPNVRFYSFDRPCFSAIKLHARLSINMKPPAQVGHQSGFTGHTCKVRTCDCLSKDVRVGFYCECSGVHGKVPAAACRSRRRLGAAVSPQGPNEGAVVRIAADVIVGERDRAKVFPSLSALSIRTHSSPHPLLPSL
jgi:hypothetical protein